MALQTVTLQLPEAIYRRIKRAAEATRQPVEDILVHTIAAGLPPSVDREQIVVVYLHRFDPKTQVRFNELMDRSNEGTLSLQERVELTGLVAEYERMMLTNSEALLRATQPQLFAPSGRPIKARLKRAAREQTHVKVAAEAQAKGQR
jgi:hypothetical protein